MQKARKRFTAWLLLTAALAAHIADEATSGFLDLYNPTVRAIRERHPWLPLPTFTFPLWIALLALAVVGLLVLSYCVRCGAAVPGRDSQRQELLYRRTSPGSPAGRKLAARGSNRERSSALAISAICRSLPPRLSSRTMSRTGVGAGMPPILSGSP